MRAFLVPAGKTLALPVRSGNRRWSVTGMTAGSQIPLADFRRGKLLAPGEEGQVQVGAKIKKVRNVEGQIEVVA